MIASTTFAQSFEQDKITAANGKAITITFIGHGSLVFDFEGKKIYVDPTSEYADYAKLPKADLIIYTHDHSDHFDKKSLEAARSLKSIVVANPQTAKQIDGAVVMKNGDSHKVEIYADIDAVPAYNTTAGRDIYHPKGRDNGYVLTLGGTKIYIAGDTEDILEMKNLKNIDIAFLPVNQPYTMLPTQAAAAAKIIKPKILYPYHFGETKIRDLDSLLKDSGIEVRYRKMQ